MKKKIIINDFIYVSIGNSARGRLEGTIFAWCQPVVHAT